MAYGLSCAFGMVDFTPVAEAAWIGLPEFTLPVVDVTAIVLVSPIAIIVVIEHIGHLFVIGEMTHRNYNPILWRSLLGDGLATTVAGLLGAPPATTFAENIGVLNVTRVYSTSVLVCCRHGIHRWRILSQAWGRWWALFPIRLSAGCPS
mgnify:CR=1 FL=1